MTGNGVRPAVHSRNSGRRLLILLVPILIVVVVGVTGWVYYYTFYHHVTQQEISHAVEHGDFQSIIRNGQKIAFQVYHQSNARDQTLVLFTSGDGGWSPFCADIAAHLAAAGYTVVGFDIKDYLTTFASSDRPVSPEEIGRDYKEILAAARLVPGVNRNGSVILGGWSLGAGYSVLAATMPEISSQVERVLAVSLPVQNELAWKPTDALIYITHGTPHEKVFDAHEYLAKLRNIPIVILNASDDDTSPKKDAQSLYAAGAGPKKLYIVKASGHHMEGGEKEFYMDLDDAMVIRVPTDPAS